MISEVVDGVAGLILACEDGNEKAIKDFQDAVSEGMLRGEDDVHRIVTTYIKDMKAKVAQLEETKRNARDANSQWDKFSPEHNIAAQSQVAFGSARALLGTGISVDHMFTAAKKAYTDMIDAILYIADYATKNHTLMQAFGIELCFVIANEPHNMASMAGVEGNTLVVLGSDKFRHVAAKLILNGTDDADDEEDEEDDVE